MEQLGGLWVDGGSQYAGSWNTFTVTAYFCGFLYPSRECRDFAMCWDIVTYLSSFILSLDIDVIF